MPNFGDSPPQLVNVATSSECSQHESQTDRITHMSTNAESLMKIGPVHSEITGLQRYKSRQEVEVAFGLKFRNFPLPPNKLNFLSDFCY